MPPGVASARRTLAAENAELARQKYLEEQKNEQPDGYVAEFIKIYGLMHKVCSTYQRIDASGGASNAYQTLSPEKNICRFSTSGPFLVLVGETKKKKKDKKEKQKKKEKVADEDTGDGMCWIITKGPGNHKQAFAKNSQNDGCCCCPTRLANTWKVVDRQMKGMSPKPELKIAEITLGFTLVLFPAHLHIDNELEDGPGKGIVVRGFIAPDISQVQRMSPRSESILPERFGGLKI